MSLPSFHKALANEWATKQMNVNAIASVYMATDIDRIPAGRWGAADDITGTAIFLCSSASDYVHGHILAVDGGWFAR